MQAWLAVNLRPDTLTPDFRRQLRPRAYLVPPSQLSARLREAARGLERTGPPLIVDNGLFDDITRIAKALGAEATGVRAALGPLGNETVRATLPEAVRTSVDNLATQVENAAATVQGMSLESQLTLYPKAVIGAEDVVAATWLRVGLDAPLLDQVRSRLARRNRKVATTASRIALDLRRRAPGVRYHAVASALDYDSARDAGRAFGSARLGAAAMGFGAYMADDSYTRTLTVGGRAAALPRLMPLRYLRCALVARGFWDGWRAATGAAPPAFHFLGLGAPIMLGIAAVAAVGTPLLTFDATSPIQDAVEGTLYAAPPNPSIKIRTRRAAEHLASGHWSRWTCPCPFCRAFVRRYPFQYAVGRSWAKGRGADVQVLADDLKPTGALFAAYPLFSEPAGGELRAQVSQARSGHNHWVLQRMLADLEQHGRTRASLERHVRMGVEAYARATSGDVYAAAVRTALAVATGAQYVPK